jgi:hypothetical protein
MKAGSKAPPRRGLRRSYGSQAAAIASQVVMLVVMVMFTIPGIGLLSAALDT